MAALTGNVGKLVGLAAGIALLSAPIFAAPASSSPKAARKASRPQAFSWLSPQPKVQDETLSLLQQRLKEAHEKAEQKRDPRFKHSGVFVPPLVVLQRPQIPRDALIAWHNARYAPVFSGRAKPEEIVQLVGEDLLAARALLSDKKPEDQRRGLRLAMWAQSRGANTLKDARLSSLIYQGWILPHLAASAPEDWKDLSRLVLLQNAVGIFLRSGDSTLRKEVLKVLIATAKDANPRDAARLQLAEMLEAEGRFRDAIALLNRLETHELSGTRAAWIAQMEEKQRQASQALQGK